MKVISCSTDAYIRRDRTPYKNSNIQVCLLGKDKKRLMESKKKKKQKVARSKR